MRARTLIAASLAVAYSLGAVAAAAAADGRLILYKKDSGMGLGMFGGKLLHSYGYKDKQLENGHWLVTGQAKSDDPRDSHAIAIYRAAELAKLQGARFIKILAVNGRSLNASVAGATPNVVFYGGNVSYGTRFVAEVEFADATDAAVCASNVLNVDCVTIDVDAAMQQIRPMLKMAS